MVAFAAYVEHSLRTASHKLRSRKESELHGAACELAHAYLRAALGCNSGDEPVGYHRATLALQAQVFNELATDRPETLRWKEFCVSRSRRLTAAAMIATQPSPPGQPRTTKRIRSSGSTGIKRTPHHELLSEHLRGRRQAEARPSRPDALTRAQRDQRSAAARKPRLSRQERMLPLTL